MMNFTSSITLLHHYFIAPIFKRVATTINMPSCSVALCAVRLITEEQLQSAKCEKDCKRAPEALKAYNLFTGT